ncbi:MAG TPA: response regulator [Alloacidobacterium sp.]|jgi:CheY-like chemotaxis protein|nr:response regulator [Alloacidobacterium sp.]
MGKQRILRTCEKPEIWQNYGLLDGATSLTANTSNHGSEALPRKRFMSIAAILLVDDNPVQAATRKAILTHAGNSVSMATDAQQALHLLANPDFAKEVKLVITDHLMPQMNGPQFVAKLRLQLPNLPVLVLSGLPDAEGEYAGMNVLYRLKPMDPEELIGLAQSLPAQTLGRTA